MLKKTITFLDLDGNPVTEDFYFNLSKAEIAELELSYKGGLTSHLQTIIETEDGQEIMDTFKRIIRMSVGRRSEDGRRFIKNEEVVNEFMQTDAYSELFVELVTDAEKATAFVKGIVPADLQEALANGETVTDLKSPLLNQSDEDVPAWIAEDREPTPVELQTMSREEMQEVFRRRQNN